MVLSQIYIFVSVAVLIILAILFIFVIKSKKERIFSPMISLAFGFILAGIIFGEEKEIGYSLIGVGVLFAIMEGIIIFRKWKRKKR
jgi:hypothetical protein